MSQYRRFHVGQIYFFTVVTHLRQPMLCQPLARQFLREALRDVRSSRPLEIVAIVLLPDHLHTVWKLPRGDTRYSTRLAHMKATFTSTWLSAGGTARDISDSRLQHGEQGVWQRRFYEHTCRDEADLKRCVDYIHFNPVKHGLVERVRDWPYSSFHRYVKQGEYPIDWGGSPELYGDEFAEFE